MDHKLSDHVYSHEIFVDAKRKLLKNKQHTATNTACESVCAL